MVSYLPGLSLTLLVAILLPLGLGFIVGLLIKGVLKVGLAVAAFVLILLFLGIITPVQVLTPLASLIRSGGSSASITAEVSRLSQYLPWSSITFLVGIAIGFVKG